MNYAMPLTAHFALQCDGQTPDGRCTAYYRASELADAALTRAEQAGFEDEGAMRNFIGAHVREEAALKGWVAREGADFCPECARSFKPTVVPPAGRRLKRGVRP